MKRLLAFTLLLVLLLLLVSCSENEPREVTFDTTILDKEQVQTGVLSGKTEITFRYKLQKYSASVGSSHGCTAQQLVLGCESSSHYINGSDNLKIGDKIGLKATLFPKEKRMDLIEIYK